LGAFNEKGPVIFYLQMPLAAKLCFWFNHCSGSTRSVTFGFAGSGSIIIFPGPGLFFKI
jgi:hypothetical protein